LTILGNEFMIMVNQNILILRPKFNIFWAIFIRLFLTFNTSGIIDMQTLKYKQIHLLILLMMSMGYFTVVSEWEIDYFYKILILMLPVQLTAIIYTARTKL
jgi:hypothetical protein